MISRQADPNRKAAAWLEEAESREEWARAACLATVDAEGQPSCRAVIVLRVADLVEFATGLRSRKGRELARNPLCAITWMWQGAHRQLRIEGTAELLAEDHANAAFRDQPVEAQLLAWASAEGEPQDQNELAQEVQAYRRRFLGSEVPRPDPWRVFGIRPHLYEFWSEGQSWIHECERYVIDPMGRGWHRMSVGP